MNTFLSRQCNHLLQNERQAYFLIALLAFVPFADWLSVTIICLIALRKGGLFGFKAFLVGLVSFIITTSQESGLLFMLNPAFLTFVMSYCAAVVLRITASWKQVGVFLLMLSLTGLALIHWLFPASIQEQYQALLATLKALDQNELILHILDNQKNATPELLANYLLGIKAISIIFSTLSSLMLARYCQSGLFYPGGFKNEMLQFRASGIGLILLVIASIAAYQDNSLGISCLPLLVVYLTLAGMSLLFNIVSKKRNGVALLLVLVPIIVVPYVILPVYVLFGSLDTLFNFRSRLSLTASE